MRYPVIYLHIPKTAGTSFRISAEHYFGPWNVLNDYGEKSPNTSEDILSTFYSKKDLDSLSEKGLQKRFLTGHFSLEKYREVFPESPIVTFFRNPVDRVISEFVHFVNHHQYQGSLSDFYRSKQFQNRQARALSGANPTDLDYYGITETYEVSLNRFNERYGTNFPMAVLNQGKYEGGIQELAKPNEIEEIKEINHLDEEVYRYALEHFDSQQDKPKSILTPVERYCGSLGGLRDDKIFGWTLDRESEKPAEICITVNGEERCKQVADLFREDIRRKGIHVSGNCGFEIPLGLLGKIIPGDRISVVSADKKFELINSPLTIAA